MQPGSASKPVSEPNLSELKGASESVPRRLVEISAGYWLPRALHVAAELGVADHIDRESRSAAELAAELGVNPGALDRVLRLLASEGIFERTKSGYAHNELSRALRQDHPQSMRAYVQILGAPVIWDSWTQLQRVVRTGQPEIPEIFKYFQERPRVTEIFNAAMTSKAQMAIPQVVEHYDFSGFGTVADIGGGVGHLLKALLKANPKMRGVLFDQPHVVEHAQAGADLGDRLTLQGGDFFRGPLPQCDAYVVMEVIHDWNDEQSRQILRQIRAASPSAGRLLVIETALPDEKAWAAGKGAHFGNHLDINMMVLTGGRERTPEEFAKLFADSGWRLTKVVPTASPYSIVEAVPA